MQVSFCDLCGEPTQGSLPPEAIRNGKTMNWLVSMNIIGQIPQDAGGPAVVPTDLCQSCYRRMWETLGEVTKQLEEAWKIPSAPASAKPPPVAPPSSVPPVIPEPPVKK